MDLICDIFDLTRQAYYEWQSRSRIEQQEIKAVLAAVHKIRRKHTRIGGRKLYCMVFQGPVKNRVSIGRDKFFTVLREHGLLVQKRVKPKGTSRNYRQKRRYENLINDSLINRPNQAWAGDITRLRTRKHFYYLTSIDDLATRKIIASDLRRGLHAEGALTALNKALETVHDPAGLIYHSDNGSQFECRDFKDRLSGNGMHISRTAKGAPWENGIAERIFGILKQEYALDHVFDDEDQLRKAVDEAIYLYNNERPHTSLDYKTPQQAYQFFLN